MGFEEDLDSAWFEMGNIDRDAVTPFTNQAACARKTTESRERRGRPAFEEEPIRLSAVPRPGAMPTAEMSRHMPSPASQAVFQLWR